MMNSHHPYDAWLSLYAAGQLSDRERETMEQHLAGCPACQVDLALWQSVADEINTANRFVAAPPDLAERALVRVRQRRPAVAALSLGLQLLAAQVRLVQKELWAASAAVMAIGVAVMFIAQQNTVIYFLAPLVAATCLALIYGPDHDPAAELALAAPTSPWKVLLARATLVFSFNLALALAASLALLGLVPQEMLSGLILAWLGPLAFLSALALLLSVWFGAGPALLVSYVLWLAQFQPVKLATSPVHAYLLEVAQRFWLTTPLLLTLSVILAAAALFSAGSRAQPLSHPGQ